MKRIFENWNKFINENKNFGDKIRGETNEEEIPVMGMSDAPDTEAQPPAQYLASLLKSAVNNIRGLRDSDLPGVADQLNGMGIEGLNARYTDGTDVSASWNPHEASRIPQIVVELPNSNRKHHIMTRRHADEPTAVVGTLAID